MLLRSIRLQSTKSSRKMELFTSRRTRIRSRPTEGFSTSVVQPRAMTKSSSSGGTHDRSFGRVVRLTNCSGSGTLGAIEGLRGGGYKGAITVLSKEGYRPIDRTKLSKALLADLSKAAWRQPEFYKDASIDILEEEVNGIDFSKKEVSTKSGKTYEYSKLILATGGTPRWLPLDGLKGDLGNVFLLRTLPDAQNIVKAVGDNGKKIVVVGSSFIGMEVGNCLASMKNDVTVVGMEDGKW
jgi:NADH dehydrogenase FAD-containing subunit